MKYYNWEICVRVRMWSRVHTRRRHRHHASNAFHATIFHMHRHTTIQNQDPTQQKSHNSHFLIYLFAGWSQPKYRYVCRCVPGPPEPRAERISCECVAALLLFFASLLFLKDLLWNMCAPERQTAHSANGMCNFRSFLFQLKPSAVPYE